MEDIDKIEDKLHQITNADLSQFENETPQKSPKMKLSMGGLDINTDYPASSGNYTVCYNKSNNWIVVHYVGANGKGYSTARYFQTAGRQASANFVVGLACENAQIYEMVKPEYKSWHCGDGGIGAYKYDCYNSNSISIETACHNDVDSSSATSTYWYFDDETIDMEIQLIRYLMATYNIDVDHVIRHYDVTQKWCPRPMVGDDINSISGQTGNNMWYNFKQRLAYEDAPTIVSSVSNKIGIAYDYWIKILRGNEMVNPAYIKGLFQKACNTAGKTYTDDTLYSVVTDVLGINSMDYWKSVINGETIVSVGNMNALFAKINNAM